MRLTSFFSFNSLRPALLALLAVGSLSSYATGRGQHAAYINMGFNEGGFGLGADYEYGIQETFGIGGYTRFYNDDDDRGVPGVFAFGAFLRPHFQRAPWDLYVGPGIGIVTIDGNNNDETTLAPSIAIGVLYEFNNQVSVGFENMKHYVWFNDDYRGLLIDDLSVKFRVKF